VDNINPDAWHPSFFIGEDVLKSIIEFELPEDSEEHYNALHGSKYRELITILLRDIDGYINCGNDVQAEYLTMVSARIRALAVELDVKVFRA